MSPFEYFLLVFLVLAVCAGVSWFTARGTRRSEDAVRARALEDELHEVGAERAHLRLKVANLERIVMTEEEPVRVVIPTGDATLLKPERLAEVWRECDPKSELYLAFRQAIALELVDAIDGMSDPRLAEKPGALSHAAGAVDRLAVLLGKVQGRKF